MSLDLLKLRILDDLNNSHSLLDMTINKSIFQNLIQRHYTYIFVFVTAI